MPKQVTVKLGGREYTIKEKPSGQNHAWRTKLRATSVMRVFESLDSVISDLVAMVQSVPEGGGWQDIDMGQAFGLPRILPTTINALTNSVDDIIDLLHEYEPKLRTERKWLGENAYDDEYVAAFLEVLKLAFPLMGALEMVSGFRAQRTSSNSPSQNGALPLPPEGPKKAKQIPAPVS